jgi:hypothetical protein
MAYMADGNSVSVFAFVHTVMRRLFYHKLLLLNLKNSTNSSPRLFNNVDSDIWEVTHELGGSPETRQIVHYLNSALN